jgi:hypothetical protein
MDHAGLMALLLEDEAAAAGGHIDAHASADLHRLVSELPDLDMPDLAHAPPDAAAPQALRDGSGAEQAEAAADAAAPAEDPAAPPFTLQVPRAIPILHAHTHTHFFALTQTYIIRLAAKVFLG